MLPWKLRKRHILPVNQNLSSVYFSLAKFQYVSCNLSLAMIWQMTYTHKLPKLCSATLTQYKLLVRKDFSLAINREAACEVTDFFIIFYFICHEIITKNIGKEEKKKWPGDLTETIGAYERLALLEL